MTDINHNFNEVEYGFPRLNGDEIKGLDCNIGCGGFSIANVGYGAIYPTEEYAHEQRRANARRIAACINYCNKMELPTEELEDI